MSRPRLHTHLNELFSQRTPELLEQCLTHEDYSAFMLQHRIKVPVSELVQAFIHTSFTHEYQIPHQEQLEFLGDAVLQLILTDELYKRFPSEKEGHLSKLRSALVNEKTLSRLARGLHLDQLILVGKGEFKKGLYQQPMVLADTFEALLAQIYRHQGFDFTKELFFKWLQEFVPQAFEKDFLEGFDSKSKLQELCLARHKKLPSYAAEVTPEGVEVKLWLEEKLLARGIFPSRKIGEKELAQSVLKKDLI